MSLTDTALARTERALEEARARVAELEAVCAKSPTEWCMEERADGNGGCGACALCCKETRDERDNAREELAAVMSVAKGYEETNRRLRAEVERLRAALVMVRDAMVATGQEPDGDDDPRRPVATAVWSALAGAPVESRREHDRALAERVREAIAQRIEGLPDDAASWQGVADNVVRALDLDALLEEP